MGLTLAAHGSQKLFGWFEGPGRAGTTGMFTKLGFRRPTTMALLAGAAEFFGGLLFALGLLTPFAAIALVVVMLNAIVTVHWQKGFFVTAGGYEYNLVLLTALLLITEQGPGKASLDAALGIEKSGSGWAIAELAAGAAGSALSGKLAETAADAPPAEEPVVEYREAA